MKEVSLFSIVVFVLFVIPVTLTASAEVNQVSGVLSAELKPGDSKILEWKFISDSETALKLDALGEISDFLSFPKEVTLENGVNTVEVVANIKSRDTLLGFLNFCIAAWLFLK